MRRCLVVSALVVMSALSLGASSAQAAECGTSPSGGGEATKGALTLQEGKSVTTLSFKRHTKDRRLVLVFSVQGCEVTSATGITITPLSSELSESTFGDAAIAPQGTLVTIQIPVHPKEFTPDDYKFSLTVSGPTIVTSVLPAEVKRSDDRMLIPLLLWFGAVVVGFAWAAYTVWLSTSEAHKAGVTFVIAYFPVALIAAFGAAWVILKQAYLDVEVWQLTIASVIALVFTTAAAAAGAATTGPLAKAIVGKTSLARARR
jgi:hypothetical protein